MEKGDKRREKEKKRKAYGSVVVAPSFDDNGCALLNNDSEESEVDSLGGGR